MLCQNKKQQLIDFIFFAIFINIFQKLYSDLCFWKGDPHNSLRGCHKKNISNWQSWGEWDHYPSIWNKDFLTNWCLALNITSRDFLVNSRNLSNYSTFYFCVYCNNITRYEVKGIPGKNSILLYNCQEVWDLINFWKSFWPWFPSCHNLVGPVCLSLGLIRPVSSNFLRNKFSN